MASRYEQYVNALNQASLLAQKELSELWGRLDASNPRACRDALIAYVPVIVYRHSLMAALAAAQYYESERLAAGGNEGFEAMIADAVPYEQIEASIRYAVGHLFPEDDDGVRPEQDGSLFGGQDR
ncbi:MAG: hypothetical protein IJR41_04830 [Atopobiaceae bacterium]|nr:hypothetical protein [Atopobiaceae bacterium]